MHACGTLPLRQAIYIHFNGCASDALTLFGKDFPRFSNKQGSLSHLSDEAIPLLALLTGLLCVRGIHLK